MTYKIHLMTMNNKAVGCGWQISQQSQRFGFPSDWPVEPNLVRELSPFWANSLIQWTVPWTPKSEGRFTLQWTLLLGDHILRFEEKQNPQRKDMPAQLLRRKLIKARWLSLQMLHEKSFQPLPLSKPQVRLVFDRLAEALGESFSNQPVYSYLCFKK